MNIDAAPLLWFIAIIALIPALLWMLKRTPLGGAGAAGVMRTVAALPLSPNQRVVTIEVGEGEAKRWLVLGVTAHSITTLHTLPPGTGAPLAAPQPPFAQLLGRLRRDTRDANAP